MWIIFTARYAPPPSRFSLPYPSAKVLRYGYFQAFRPVAAPCATLRIDKS